MIYTITTVRAALNAGSRCVGYYETFQEAEYAIKNNIMDINEHGYYKYAVIENIEPGIYNYNRREIWYQWNVDKEQYEECPKPERFLKVCGWAIG